MLSDKKLALTIATPEVFLHFIFFYLGWEGLGPNIQKRVATNYKLQYCLVGKHVTGLTSTKPFLKNAFK